MSSVLLLGHIHCVYLSKNCALGCPCSGVSLSHSRKPCLSGHKEKRSLSDISDRRLRSCYYRLASARARFLSGFNLFEEVNSFSRSSLSLYLYDHFPFTEVTISGVNQLGHIID